MCLVDFGGEREILMSIINVHLTKGRNCEILPQRLR